ncbi:GPW/gp25 family protein [Nostoc parmelioides]|uniref:GPW/gp25 family protein n=1 Tax=Nostoc parmelioides FACHB-3921 TaxID=2692909 RepID=A0ABR8BG80_9NOSO|nr:GPW/gp25 family protein [Nostoc parmelioides]MBD2251978.1 GPW/gp25 family protein [Nostoc parmelioides FACHB-3921]
MADFLGVGWTAPVQLMQTGQIAMAREEDAIRQAILMILATAKGERIMRPDFGCGIHDLVFAPNTPSTIGQLVSEVQDALIEWEPRIDVLDVDALPFPSDRTRIQIQINYRVRTTNNRFNLVYPFYLQ